MTRAPAARALALATAPPRAPRAKVLLWSALSALALVGSITLVHDAASGSLVGRSVETPLGRLASGSAVGVNATNATASIAGTLLTGTTNVWWLNNTNASGAYHAKIDVVSSSGVANLALLRVGIDNGTQTDQVLAAAGALTQTGGAYVQLPAASSNRIYATQAVLSLGSPSQLVLRVTLSDDVAESATVEMRATLSLT